MAKRSIPDVWGFIRYSGRMENIQNAPGRSRTFDEVMLQVYQEMQTAGSNHDSPKTLFFNGDPIQLPGNKPLHSFAYEYGTARYEATSRAVREHIAKWKPEALKESEDESDR